MSFDIENELREKEKEDEQKNREFLDDFEHRVLDNAKQNEKSCDKELKGENQNGNTEKI